MTAPIQTLDATEAAQAVDAIVQRAEARYDAHRQEIFASTVGGVTRFTTPTTGGGRIFVGTKEHAHVIAFVLN